MKYLIKNARIINPKKSQDFIGDLLIENGLVSEIGENISCDCEILDAKGLCLAPGLVDMHVHLRDPGLTYKEDIITGCSAASAGGITSLLCMPNTNPTIDSAETVDYIIETAKKATAKVYVACAVTKSLKSEEPCDLEEMKKHGAVAITDDGSPVVNVDFLEKAMKLAPQIGLRYVAHCEDLNYVKKSWKMNEGEISKELGLIAVPNISEDSGTEREIKLAEKLSVPVHICHVSTGKSADLIRQAKKKGLQVSGETAPHYMLMTDRELLKKDADYRMNPPLRCEEDRLAMIEAVLDGTIEVIATDHAPHSVKEKVDFENAPNGVIGMETSLAGTITAIGDSVSLSKIIDMMSVKPAEILGINAGVLEKGKPADIVIFDPKEKWVVDANKMHGKSKNAIFKGTELTGKVKYTLLNGEIVYRGE
ncbi:MAG: dihydroorotase [Clostridia bacterium]